MWIFEKRGYSDTAELQEHAIPQLPARTPSKVFDFDAKKVFDKPDNAKLKDKRAIDEAGKFLEENRFGLAVIASSEAKGDTEKLRALTAASAKVVRDYLTETFKVDDKGIKIIGLGKDKKSETSKLTIFIYRLAAQPPASSPTGS